jgi:hypothetical protein
MPETLRRKGVGVMREQLEGRNLAHVGCLIGLILGLSGGIILAWMLILHSVAAIVALLLWFGLTVLLGGVGYITGSAVSTQPADPPAVE